VTRHDDQPARTTPAAGTSPATDDTAPPPAAPATNPTPTAAATPTNPPQTSPPLTPVPTAAPAAPAAPTFTYQIANSCITTCGGVHRRASPSSTSPAIGNTLDQGEAVHVVCQAFGEPVTNDKGVTTSVWNQLDDGTWVPDAFVNTPGLPGPGTPGFSGNIPRC
jgi:hypothetical protein